MSRDAMNDDAPIADVGTTRRNAAKTIEEAMASSTIARLAWSGWTHVTRRRRETNAARDGAVAGSVATNERANADRVGANHEV